MTTEEAQGLRYSQGIFINEHGHWLDFMVLRYNEDNNEVEGWYWEDSSHYGYQNHVTGSFPLERLSLVMP